MEAYGMAVNKTISKVVVISREEVHIQIHMNGKLLEQVVECKYLGVTISCNRSW